MGQWNPFDFAIESADFNQLQSWERERCAFQSGLQIVVSPQPLLQFSRPDEFDEYGPLSGVWDDSTNDVLDIYAQALSSALQAEPFRPFLLERWSYTPPSAWRRGGPISFPLEILEVALRDPVMAEAGRAILYSAIADGLLTALANLRSWCVSHSVPEDVQSRPSHSVTIVEAMVQYHAQHAYPALRPRTAVIHSVLDITGDAPLGGLPYLGTVAYAGGTLIYLVDDRLRIHQVLRSQGDASIPLPASNYLDEVKGDGSSDTMKSPTLDSLSSVLRDRE
jgi:hypothetical protein